MYPTDATDECHPAIFKSDLRRFFARDSLKVPKLLFRFLLSCKLVGNIYKRKFVCSRLVRAIKYCQIAKSCSCHRRVEEKDLSPAALVAGFTYGYDFSYHTLFGFRKLLDLG